LGGAGLEREPLKYASQDLAVALGSSYAPRTIPMGPDTASSKVKLFIMTRSSGEICISSDGSWIAWANYPDIVLLDSRSGRPMRVLAGANIIGKPYFSPDGCYISQVGHHFRMCVVETSSGRRLWSLGDDSKSIPYYTRGGLCFSHDSRWLASGIEGGPIKLYEVATGQLFKTFETHASGYCTSISISTDGCSIASAHMKHKVNLWEAASGRLIRILEGHTDAVNSVCFSPDGRLLASGSSDKTVRLWDVDTGSLLWTIQNYEGIVYGVAFSPDGRFIVTISEGGIIMLWEITPRQLRWSVADSKEGTVPHFSSDGRSVFRNGSCGITSWDLATGRQLGSFEGLCTSDDYSPLSVSSGNGNESPECVFGGLLRFVEFTYAKFSADARLAAMDNKVWDVASRRLLRRFGNYDYSVDYFWLSADGRRFALKESYDTSLQLWDVVSGRLLRTIAENEDLSEICFSPDGNWCLCTCIDGSLRMWEIRSAGILGVPKARVLWTSSAAGERADCIAFSPDGRFIVSGHFRSSDGTLKLWEAHSGRLLRSFATQDPVNRVCFSPDGRILASGNFTGGSTLLWDIPTGRLLRTLPIYGVFHSMSFSPSGRCVFVGHHDSLLVWNLDGDLLLTVSKFGGEWVAETPDGRYRASIGAEPYVYFVRDTRIIEDPEFKRSRRLPRGLLPGVAEFCG
jgi:WD40 repeat protein